jgi:hypothetical protein
LYRIGVKPAMSLFHPDTQQVRNSVRSPPADPPHHLTTSPPHLHRESFAPFAISGRNDIAHSIARLPLRNFPAPRWFHEEEQVAYAASLDENNQRSCAMTLFANHHRCEQVMHVDNFFADEPLSSE